jgi:hypothetical protein
MPRPSELVVKKPPGIEPSGKLPEWTPAAARRLGPPFGEPKAGRSVLIGHTRAQHHPMRVACGPALF